jgi:hypothetical protein
MTEGYTAPAPRSLAARILMWSPARTPTIGTKVSRHPPALPATIGFMKLSRAVKLIGEFLGFLLVSTGGTLLCIGVLLVLSRIGLGGADAGPMVGWLDLVLGSGVSGIAMVAAGICLVRRFKT